MKAAYTRRTEGVTHCRPVTPTVKSQRATVQHKYRGWWNIGDPRSADSVTNHFTTPLRETGFRAITFPRSVKFQWGYKNLRSVRFKSVHKKTGLGGEKHWFYSPNAHDHAYRYSCWTPLIAALYLTIKSTVFLQPHTRIQKRHTSNRFVSVTSTLRTVLHRGPRLTNGSGSQTLHVRKHLY